MTYDDGTNDPTADPSIRLLDLANTIAHIADEFRVMGFLARDAGLPDASDLHDLHHMLHPISALLTGLQQAWDRRESDGHTSWQHLQAACSVVGSVVLAEVYVDTIREMGGDVGYQA